MASITDPYYFLPDSEISSDAFSSSLSIFYHMSFKDSKENLNSQNSERSNYDFYSHIQTIHPDDETLTKLAPHRQPSKFIWATSFQISEQSFLFAIFIPFGLIIWNSKQRQQQSFVNENESEFYKIKPVELQKATFIDCINSRSLIFTYNDEKLLYVIHNVGKNANIQDEEDSSSLIKQFNISDTIRTFCQLSPEKALIITNGNSAIIFDVPSLTITKSSTLNFIFKKMPFRNPNICDSIILATNSLPSDYDDNDENIIAASYYHLSVFDNKNESFTFRNTVNTVIGTPKLISVIGSTAYLIIKNEKEQMSESETSKFSFLQVNEIYGGESSGFNKIYFDSNDSIINIIAIEKDVCCVLTRYCIHLIITGDITFQFSLVISKSPNDFIFTGSLISDHTISVMTAREGNHIFEILPFEQLLRLIPYQINRIFAALNLFQQENEMHANGQNGEANHQGSLAILEDSNIDDEAFYEMDRTKITCLSHYNMIQDFLKLHIDLVKLFYIYMSKLSQDELKKIDVFEINAYSLLCFNETFLYVGSSVSFEFDVLKNAITRRDLKTIFSCIRSDIKTKHYIHLDFLIGMADSCYEHYSQYEEVYLSSLKCHPEIIKLIDEALQSFKGQKKSISDHLDQYAKLCSLSFLFTDTSGDDDDDETQHKIEKPIGYAMELFNLDDEYKQRAIECVEQIALDHTVIELMACILHETQLFTEKCNLYYDKFNNIIIMPILTFMLNHDWLSDILDIGEIPEWRPYVTDLLMMNDSLFYAFHLITEDGDELGRAAILLWESVSKGITNKNFTIDQAASLCSVALMCLTIKINEIESGISSEDDIDQLRDVMQQVQDQFMLLELLKTSAIGDKNAVLSPNEMMKYFIDQKDYVVALSVYACSLNYRNESENAENLAKIISLMATSWREPLTDGSFEQVLVESRALEKTPSEMTQILENLLAGFDKKDVVMNIIASASQKTVPLEF